MPDACEMPRENATPAEVREILSTAKTVAVVGLSDKPDRDSYRIAEYLQRAGYRIVPVNPAVSEVLGERSYASLRDVPEKVDVVDVFRRAEAVPAIVEDAIAVGAGAVWMQDGIVHNEAAERARAAGLKVVMSKCMLREHRAMSRER
jgi:predicted CoA-binding protein